MRALFASSQALTPQNVLTLTASVIDAGGAVSVSSSLDQVVPELPAVETRPELHMLHQLSFTEGDSLEHKSSGVVPLMLRDRELAFEPGDYFTASGSVVATLSLPKWLHEVGTFVHLNPDGSTEALAANQFSSDGDLSSIELATDDLATLGFRPNRDATGRAPLSIEFRQSVDHTVHGEAAPIVLTQPLELRFRDGGDRIPSPDATTSEFSSSLDVWTLTLPSTDIQLIDGVAGRAFSVDDGDTRYASEMSGWSQLFADGLDQEALSITASHQGDGVSYAITGSLSRGFINGLQVLNSEQFSDDQFITLSHDPRVTYGSSSTPAADGSNTRRIQASGFESSSVSLSLLVQHNHDDGTTTVHQHELILGTGFTTSADLSAAIDTQFSALDPDLSLPFTVDSYEIVDDASDLADPPSSNSYGVELTWPQADEGENEPRVQVELQFAYPTISVDSVEAFSYALGVSQLHLPESSGGVDGALPLDHHLDSAQSTDSLNDAWVDAQPIVIRSDRDLRIPTALTYGEADGSNIVLIDGVVHSVSLIRLDQGDSDIPLANSLDATSLAELQLNLPDPSAAVAVRSVSLSPDTLPLSSDSSLLRFNPGVFGVNALDSSVVIPVTVDGALQDSEGQSYDGQQLFLRWTTDQGSINSETVVAGFQVFAQS